MTCLSLDMMFCKVWDGQPSQNLLQAFHAARNPDVFPRLQDRQIQLRGALPGKWW